MNKFVSRYFRGSLTSQLNKRYQNLKRLKTTIENHISVQKFNIIEIMGGYLWLFSDKKLFLQIDTHMSIRYGFEKTDLRDSLLTVSPNILRFNSEAIETGNTTYASLDSFVTTDMSQRRVLSEDNRGDLDLDVAQINLNQSPIPTRDGSLPSSGIRQSSQKPEGTSQNASQARRSLSLFEKNDIGQQTFFSPLASPLLW